jgi:hypothetical protein
MRALPDTHAANRGCKGDHTGISFIDTAQYNSFGIVAVRELWSALLNGPNSNESDGAPKLGSDRRVHSPLPKCSST